MLKVYTRPMNRRPIVARKDSKQAGELELADETIAEPQRENYRDDAVQVKLTEVNIELHGCRHIELQDCATQTHSPNHFLKRTKFRYPPAATIETPKEITFHARFHKYWHHEGILGEGGDGVVHLYQQWKRQGMFIAVKLPRYYSARKDLVQEIKNMRTIGQHKHILDLCHTTENWYPYGPALFLPVCELGNLIDYRESCCAKQAWEGKPKRVSEITMWKLFRDMVLALNYLHHELGTRYVHNDFKPQNILAVRPPDNIEGQALPEEPIFKLSDFARLTPWPTPKGQHPQGFNGTPEYAPPEMEQIAPVQASADIWGLGATLQFMALGIIPIQTREAFVRSRKAQGKTYPHPEDHQMWMSEYWRTRVPTVFRPINVPLTVLQKDYDLPFDLPGYHHYGARLGFWYAQLWKPVATRPKASKLVREAIPHMDDHVERLKLDCLKQMC